MVLDQEKRSRRTEAKIEVHSLKEPVPEECLNDHFLGMTVMPLTEADLPLLVPQESFAVPVKSVHFGVV
jgi:hypothetical protein